MRYSEVEQRYAGRDYRVYIQARPSPFSRMIAAPDYDIQAINDNSGGSQTGIFYTDPHTGCPVEIDRVRQGVSSAMVLAAPLVDANRLQRYYDPGCLFSIMREPPCDDDMLRLWTGVSIDRIDETAVAGCGQTGEPLASVPTQWRSSYDIDRTAVVQEFICDDATPLAVAFCASGGGCSVCCGGSLDEDCSHVYAVFSTLCQSVLAESLDGGQSWTDLQTITATSLLCVEGRLFIGTNNGQVVWSDDLSGDSTAVSVGGDGATVIKFVRAGQLIYALWANSDGFGLDISSNHGESWRTLVSDLIGGVRDVAAAGAYWALAVENGVLVGQVRDIYA